MEHQGIQDPGETEDEKFPDEFQCCVCLDIMYKPVVLACGHISCFWCVFKAMDTFQESHCPVCRNPYNHFPRICELLHFLLLKLYPLAYKRRERQVAEEEKKCGCASPQFDNKLIDSQFSEANDVRDISSSVLGAIPIESNATYGGDHSSVQDSLRRTFREDNTTTIPTISSSQTTTNETNSVVEHTNKVLVTDLQCEVCKQLLCRPIVLNCGHVFCEACIDPHDSVCKCPVCQSAHPKGFPNVCLVLEHFLEEHFPEEYSTRKESGKYSTRKESLPHFQSSKEKQEQAAQSSSVPTHVYSSWFSGDGAKFHPGVGCDYCGMCPIIGLRYRCKDCVEEIGFDLCESCYNSSSKRPGRFNQQHTKEHQFEVIQPRDFQNIILSLGVSVSAQDDETGVSTDSDELRRPNNASENELAIAASPNASDDPQYYVTGAVYDETDVSTDNPDEVLIVHRSNNALENELEITASLYSSDGDPQELENARASPNSSNNSSEDQVGNSAT